MGKPGSLKTLGIPLTPSLISGKPRWIPGNARESGWDQFRAKGKGPVRDTNFAMRERGHGIMESGNCGMVWDIAADTVESHGRRAGIR